MELGWDSDGNLTSTSSSAAFARIGRANLNNDHSITKSKGEIVIEKEGVSATLGISELNITVPLYSYEKMRSPIQGDNDAEGREGRNSPLAQSEEQARENEDQYSSMTPEEIREHFGGSPALDPTRGGASETASNPSPTSGGAVSGGYSSFGNSGVGSGQNGAPGDTGGVGNSGGGGGNSDFGPGASSARGRETRPLAVIPASGTRV